MLTFRFTGVNGEMIEEEMLAAGMVGKQVQFVFSEEWEGLRKVAVYKAGDACCTTVDVQTVDTIPAEVLEHSLQRLQVGVYGISEDGSVVTPTIYATGPFIHISAVLGDDPCFDPENTFWIRLEEAIGELTELTTEEKTSLVLAINENQRKIHALAKEMETLDEPAQLAKEAVRFTAQSLTQSQQAQARQNIGAVSAEDLAAPGLDETAASLLVTILKNGVYATDQAENILRLSAAVCGTVLYTVENVLENVTTDNSRTLLATNDSYTGMLTPAEGYELDAVTVTMGGTDITAQVYEAGSITIPAVTGGIVITASAKKKAAVVVGGFANASISYVEGAGVNINGQNNYRATVLPTGQYLQKGATYRFSLGAVASQYRYGVQIMVARAAGLSFDYVPNGNVTYGDAISRIVDTGWMSADYTYTPDEDNRILVVCVKRVDEGAVSESDCATLYEHFTITEVAE